MSDLQTRYGKRSTPRWFWWAVAAVGVVLGIAWAAWVAFDEKPVSAQLHGYKVHSDSSVTVTLEVHVADPRSVVECAVYAQSLDHGVVGEKTVRLPQATSDAGRLVDIDVTTQERAVNGVLRSCQVID